MIWSRVQIRILEENAVLVQTDIKAMVFTAKKRRPVTQVMEDVRLMLRVQTLQDR